MQTSNFWHYTGLGRIVIARSTPHHMPPGYRIYSKLAPGAWFNEVRYKYNEALFKERYYNEILNYLNPGQEYETLHMLAGGAEPILLCWEKNPHNSHEWCHRRMVAEWFEASLGVKVPEYQRPSKSLNQLSLFDLG